MIKSSEVTSLSNAGRDFVLPQRVGSLLFASGLLLLGSCSTPRTSDEPWVYAISREVYPSMCDDGELFAALAQDSRTECGALVVLVVLALPFAIDTVLLPVTVPHDLIAVK